MGAELRTKQDSIVREWAEKLEMYLGNNNRCTVETKLTICRPCEGEEHRLASAGMHPLSEVSILYFSKLTLQLFSRV